VAVALSLREIAVLEEYSALVPKAVLETMYDEAVSVPFNFLYINTLARDIDHMFYSGFTRRFILSEMMTA
jgi:hypothetical protein